MAKGKAGRPREYNVPVMESGPGLHPAQMQWLRRRAKERGVSAAAALRELLWKLMAEEGVDIRQYRARG